MATQSLYRRYRPRRFAELKGQDHVVQALRAAVADDRVGQSYLFSGPRGTGKTSTARILAKVLNCVAPVDGEPCCECESCLAVERGTSYDVHELDAASNNGVDAMRDLIEKASLGTPGRHKVYILDEAHMLSKPASAALLKTLEEPPPHVVFVLATTDPQKLADTIRSRTQHLEFHLLPVSTLDEHVRWVASDAGLEIGDAAIAQVLARGGGSARDTLSALELVVGAGGRADEAPTLDGLVEAMIDGDPGRGLTVIAELIGRGREPRSLTEEIVAHLRNGFLALMAPELVQLPAERSDVVADQARRLGAPGLVRGIEQLGSALVEMRHAPDARVLLEVAVVRLTARDAAPDVAALAARLARVERRLDDAPTGPLATSAPEAARPSGSGRATLGGRARRAAAPSPSESPGVASDRHSPEVDAATGEATPDVVADADADADADAAPTPAHTSGGSPSVDRPLWEETVRPTLRGRVKAMYAPASFVGASGATITLGLPNDVHRDKCEQHRDAVEAALSEAAGVSVTVELVTDYGSNGGSASPAFDAPGGGARRRDAAGGGGAGGAGGGPADDPGDGEEDIDVDDLVDVPPESVKSPIDRLAEAFPGSELVEDRR